MSNNPERTVEELTAEARESLIDAIQVFEVDAEDDVDGPSKNGLAQLILALVQLLHELLEKQAIRRMDAGSLTDDEVDRLGLTLMKQAREIDRLRLEFGLRPEDLQINLGQYLNYVE